jgi:hypothetical protein
MAFGILSLRSQLIYIASQINAVNLSSTKFHRRMKLGNTVKTARQYWQRVRQMGIVSACPNQLCT